MAVIVQKFGGTSLADPACIRRCAERAVAARRAGHQVVVVVSAMGKTTDELVRLAHEVTPEPSHREMAMLLATGEQVSSALMTMTIHRLGFDAVGLSGPNLGIRTDPVHRRARIRSIDVERVRRDLDAGRIVVAAGFQGISEEGDITTLGRGGSDTTAVAFAAALDVVRSHGLCEIYTDVDGVYTADPRIVPDARRLDRISYEEMLELASLGAGVLHPRSVIFGRKYDVPIRVRSSRDDGDDPTTGTLIVHESPDMESTSVVGCALTRDLGRITVRGLPSAPGSQAAIFRRIAEAEILVDDIMQIESDGRVDLSFTAEEGELANIKLAAQTAIESMNPGATIAVEVGLAKVSVVGVGMRSHAGVAARMFQALGEAGVNIANITTSEIKISCIVPRESGDEALRVVHEAFDLAEGAETSGSLGSRPSSGATVADS